ncbi:helix-turn-helix domain-containing protein [Marinicella meishanensis]|uniref:helix-turn-helix domain-containing protein n=1 Tax=Marinicella meishanensis TaxID=2873263 RepID=UPI001CC17998|nr:AraC family transcriptional regulator [Marinicella sp. NBU2979]
MTHIILYLGIIQGLFLLLALSLMQHKKDTLISLNLLIACSVLILFADLLSINHPNLKLKLYRMEETIPLLFGPLMLAHYRSIFISNNVFKQWSTYGHFLPFVAFVLIYLSFYLQPMELKSAYITARRTNGIPASVALFAGFKGVHYLVYMLYILHDLKHQKKRSDLNQEAIHNLHGLSAILWFKVMVLVLVYGVFILQVMGFRVFLDSDRLGSLVLSFIMYLYALVMFVKPKVLLPQLKAQKYLTSGLTATDKQRIFAKFEATLNHNKLFTDPDLTLQKLASLLEVKPNQLSQVINEISGDNFYNFINALRIKEACQMMLTSEKSMLSISMDCGFNSKSAFYRAFRKVMGSSPSQFKNSQKKVTS